LIRASCLAAFACLLPFAATQPQNGATRTGRIVGVVADSVNGSPLRDAEVIATGVTRSVRTDSSGRFTIDSLPPGTYQIGVFHPLLESLGITLATQSFTLGADSAAVVNLAVPSIPSLVRRYCGDAAAATPAALVGRVLDPDTDLPISAAKVTLEWNDISVTKTTGVVRIPHLVHAESAPNGFFKFCTLPSDLNGTLQATSAGGETPEVPVAMNGALLDFESLSIPPSGSNAKGVVTGHVISTSGKPVSGARIEIPVAGVAATSREDGAFFFPAVKTGTVIIVARSLSYSTAAEVANITSREPLDVIVTLPDKVNVLDPVLVTARREYALDKNGFSARKRGGAGYFFTREDIDRRKPNNITDMLKNLPMVTVSSQRGGTLIRGRSGITSIYAQQRGNCTEVFIDGFLWRDMGPGDLDMFVNPEDVMGMEVYRSEDVPTQFRRSGAGCIAIVIWTQFRGKASK